MVIQTEVVVLVRWVRKAFVIVKVYFTIFIDYVIYKKLKLIYKIKCITIIFTGKRNLFTFQEYQINISLQKISRE